MQSFNVTAIFINDMKAEDELSLSFLTSHFTAKSSSFFFLISVVSIVAHIVAISRFNNQCKTFPFCSVSHSLDNYVTAWCNFCFSLFFICVAALKKRMRCCYRLCFWILTKPPSIRTTNDENHHHHPPIPTWLPRSRFRFAPASVSFEKKTYSINIFCWMDRQSRKSSQVLRRATPCMFAIIFFINIIVLLLFYYY